MKKMKRKVLICFIFVCAVQVKLNFALGESGGSRLFEASGTSRSPLFAGLDRSIRTPNSNSGYS